MLYNNTMTIDKLQQRTTVNIQEKATPLQSRLP